MKGGLSIESDVDSWLIDWLIDWSGYEIYKKVTQEPSPVGFSMAKAPLLPRSTRQST